MALSACSDDGLRPAPNPDGTETGFEVSSVPLLVGTRWVYDLDYTRVWFSDARIDLPPPTHLTAVGTRTLEQVETLDGRDYVVEHQVVSGGGTPVERWRRYRQDDAALYRADIALGVSPGGVGGDGTPIVDLTVLQFPLEAGDTWPQRAQRSLASFTVEALDTLVLGGDEVPAYRVRVDVAADGDDDFRLFWYGEHGFLRRYEHHEIVATDAVSGETVRIVTDETETLTSFELPVALRASR